MDFFMVECFLLLIGTRTVGEKRIDRLDQILQLISV